MELSGGRGKRQQRRAGAGRARPGQNLVELALVLPVLALILLGALDLGRVFFSYVQLTNAVREGANYGRVNPTAVNDSASADPYNISFKIQDESDLDIVDSDIAVTCYQGPSIGSTTLRGDGTCSSASGVQSGDIIQVKASARFQPITTQIASLLPSNYKISKTLRMVIQ